MNIAYNQDDTPWSGDGAWIEALDGEALDGTIARVAAQNTAACADVGDDVADVADLAEELIDQLTVVDLAGLAGLAGRDWDTLASAWCVARRNGWTSAEADTFMIAELARREEG
jgi:hypothetical protein